MPNAIRLITGDPHDETLHRHVKPSDWVNPTPLPRYQLVVIGGGSAGLICAAAAAGLGATVALVERDFLGGDCLNVGCVPSKSLLRSARAVAKVRRAADFGVVTTGSNVDFAAVMERVRRIRASLAPHDSVERFRTLGVHVFLGPGTFTGPDAVDVSGDTLKFGRCIVATGTRPHIPEIPGLEEARLYTNETIFALTELPKRLLVVGGGPMGCELAQAFARLGSNVTLFTHGGRILPREDRDAAAIVAAALKTDGVAVTSEPSLPREFDAVLLAAGRRPNVETMHLHAAGVAFDSERGILVDDFLRSTNRHIFAAGDVASFGYRFTHAADAMARLAIRNALFPTKGRASALTIPWCTYTDPEIGGIGMNEEEARARNIAVTVYRHETPLDRAATDGTANWLKVLVRPGSDRIVVATAVGPRAGELIGTLSVAMTAGVGLKQLANTVFPYPTYTEAIKKVADQYNRMRLTPRAQRLIGVWLRWFR